MVLPMGIPKFTALLTATSDPGRTNIFKNLGLLLLNDVWYQLKTKPGEFTGLQLVCYVYVGFQQISPEAEVGFDLSKEYKAAKSLVEHGD